MNEEKEAPWYETLPMGALLRHARYTYGTAMRKALDEAGYDDIPKNGLYIIGGLTLNEGRIALGQLIRELRVSKQAGSLLVDQLVLRGYLERTVDETDRRKLTVTLTRRGQDAAAVQTAARMKIDAELAARLEPEIILNARRTLGALVDIGNRDEKVSAT